MDVLQLIDPDTLLLVYKENYVHLRGRDGNPGDRGIQTAKRIIDRLTPAELDKRLVCLAGIWYDCKNPNVEVNLVTEPQPAVPYADPDKGSDRVYQSIFQQARHALEALCAEEEGQSISGCLAEFWYTGGADYEHPVNKFYGRSGLLRGLALIEDGRFAEFEHTRSWLTHPGEIRVYSYNEFQQTMKNPPRGKYGIADALQWGLITPEQLRGLFEQ